MKPAPFDEKYTYIDSNTGKRVDSTESRTEVFDKNGTSLYQIPNVFSGRRTMMLSPDGQTLILDGNYYFGNRFLRSPSMTEDEVVTLIYHQGSLWKEIRFATDLNNGKNIEVRGGSIGGGWLPRTDYIADNSVDWDRGVLLYTMIDEDSTTVDTEIKLPPTTSEARQQQLNPFGEKVRVGSISAAAREANFPFSTLLAFGFILVAAMSFKRRSQ